jgi:hypothetical protein
LTKLKNYLICKKCRERYNFRGDSKSIDVKID